VLHGLKHPNVVEMVGITQQFPGPEEQDQSRWEIGIVFEFCGGGNLGSHLEARDVQLSLGAKLGIASDVAAGLAYLHSLHMCARAPASAPRRRPAPPAAVPPLHLLRADRDREWRRAACTATSPRTTCCSRASCAPRSATSAARGA